MANIKDVAKLAGVSISSVSKAYNDYSDIRPETKTKIFEAASQLGYYPNNFASNLSKKNSNIIAVLINPNEDHDYIDEIIMLYTVSIVEAANAKKLEPYIILYDTIKDMTPQEAENLFIAKGVKGIVLFGLSKENMLLKEIINNDKFYKVIIDAQYQNKTTSSVSIDDLEAQYELFRKVHAKHNFKNYLYISGSLNAFVSIERKYGAMKFANQTPNVNLTYCDGDFNKETVETIIKDTDLSTIDCIVCASDMMALTVKKYLPAKSQIFVCGFDDIRLLEYTYPQMPTVRQDFRQKGSNAVEALNLLMKNNKSGIYIEPFEIKNI